MVSGWWLLVIGYWLFVMGYWLLVMGYWFLVISMAIEHAGAAPRNCRGSVQGVWGRHAPSIAGGLGAARPPIPNFKSCVLGGDVSFLIIETK